MKNLGVFSFLEKLLLYGSIINNFTILEEVFYELFFY